MRLQEGMIVSQDIKNAHGQMLLPSGCILNDKMLRLLKSWGISEIEVTNAEEFAMRADPVAMLSSDQFLQIQIELAELFADCDLIAEPILKDLSDCCLRRKALKCLESQKLP